MARVLGPSADRGEILEELWGRERLLRLRMGELERLEEICARGVYGLLQAFVATDSRQDVTLREVRTIVALGLVGGGMSEAAADRQVQKAQPSDAVRLRIVAQAVLTAALLPEDPEDAPRPFSGPDAGAEKTASTSGA